MCRACSGTGKGMNLDHITSGVTGRTSKRILIMLLIQL
jgi:hypothetical protein